MGSAIRLDDLPWEAVRPGLAKGVLGRTLLDAGSKVVYTRVEPGGGFPEHVDKYGHLLYVLKGTAAASNIAVVSTVTDAIKKLLPAAGGSVGLAISPDGRTLYDVVGTPAVGNIQEIRLGANGV